MGYFCFLNKTVCIRTKENMLILNNLKIIMDGTEFDKGVQNEPRPAFKPTVRTKAWTPGIPRCMGGHMHLCLFFMASTCGNALSSRSLSICVCEREVLQFSEETKESSHPLEKRPGSPTGLNLHLSAVPSRGICANTEPHVCHVGQVSH